MRLASQHKYFLILWYPLAMDFSRAFDSLVKESIQKPIRISSAKILLLIDLHLCSWKYNLENTAFQNISFETFFCSLKKKVFIQFCHFESSPFLGWLWPGVSLCLHSVVSRPQSKALSGQPLLRSFWLRWWDQARTHLAEAHQCEVNPIGNQRNIKGSKENKARKGAPSWLWRMYLTWRRSFQIDWRGYDQRCVN